LRAKINKNLAQEIVDMLDKNIPAHAAEKINLINYLGSVLDIASLAPGAIYT
jgi:hypothetical protein